MEELGARLKLTLALEERGVLVGVGVLVELGVTVEVGVGVGVT